MFDITKWHSSQLGKRCQHFANLWLQYLADSCGIIVRRARTMYNIGKHVHHGHAQFIVSCIACHKLWQLCDYVRRMFPQQSAALRQHTIATNNGSELRLLRCTTSRILYAAGLAYVVICQYEHEKAAFATATKD